MVEKRFIDILAEALNNLEERRSELIANKVVEKLKEARKDK